MNDPELVGLIESENIVIVGEITATGEKRRSRKKRL